VRVRVCVCVCAFPDDDDDDDASLILRRFSIEVFETDGSCLHSGRREWRSTEQAIIHSCCPDQVRNGLIPTE